ncbi:MAG: hypothetical protein U0793_19590 [Gemmataceae bacterium]
MTIDDPWVFDAPVVQPQEVGIVGEDNPAVRDGGRDVIGIFGAEQTGVGAGSYIDASAAESLATAKSMCSSR